MILTLEVIFLLVGLCSASVYKNCANLVGGMDDLRSHKKPVLNLKYLFEKSKKKLGEGSYGLVKEITLKNSGSNGSGLTLAVKRVKATLIVGDRYLQDYDDTAFFEDNYALFAKLYQLDKELFLMKEMGEAEYAPSLVACEYDNIHLYIAQEKMEGDFDDQSIIEIVQQKDPQSLFRLFDSFIQGLTYLFDLGYLHGDLKPGNLMTKDSFDNVYLIDFGLAQDLLVEDNNFLGTGY